MSGKTTFLSVLTAFAVLFMIGCNGSNNPLDLAGEEPEASLDAGATLTPPMEIRWPDRTFTYYSAQGNQTNGAPGGFVLEDRMGDKVLLWVSHSGQRLDETRIDLDDGRQVALLWPDTGDADGVRAEPLGWQVEIREGGKVQHCTLGTLPDDVAHLVDVHLVPFQDWSPGDKAPIILEDPAKFTNWKTIVNMICAAIREGAADNPRNRFFAAGVVICTALCIVIGVGC